MLYGFEPLPNEAAATIFGPPFAVRSIFCAELEVEATVKRKLSRERKSWRVDVPLGNVNALLSAVIDAPLTVTSDSVLSPELITATRPSKVDDSSLGVGPTSTLPLEAPAAAAKRKSVPAMSEAQSA